MAIEDFFERYSKKGYKFSDEILTRYTLSLATKPFVILSGISGTGKTKIAQLFEPEVLTPPQPPQANAQFGSGEIILKVTKGLMNGDRGNLQFSQIDHVFEPNEVVEINDKIQEILTNRPNSAENISAPVVMTIITADSQEAQIGIYLQRAQNPLVRIRVKSVRGASQKFDSTDFFKNTFNEGDVIKLSKTGVHQFTIESINNQQIIATNETNEANRLSTIDNKCFISVKSNWTDASELFGYFNPITEKYVVTKLLKFIILAKENPEIPFFVILDEMNLSKVEHYFSDFLSCIESRIVDENGNIHQEGIHLYSGSHYIQTDDDEYDEILSNLEIPLNLFVTGTVNVDDTTYMFSPKVLDRANVIEFNDVHLGDIPNNGNFKLQSFPDLTLFEKSNISMYEGLSPETKEFINGLLGILKQTNMHFGYRTISEISHFISISKKCVDNSPDTELTALDIQILQKVLPKLYGNFAKLHDPLKEVIFFLSDSKGELKNFTINEIKMIDYKTSKFSRSLEKLVSMYLTLSTQGFASFIE